MLISVINKRNELFSLLFLLLMLFLVSCVSTPPYWYLNRDKSPGFIVGMGEGETKDKAKSEALREIAEQLKVRVSTETHIKEKEFEGESSLLFEQNIKTATDIILSGVEKVSEEKRGDVYYVTYRYDNRPLRVRVLEKIQNGELTSLYSGIDSSFKKALPFYRFLKENMAPGDFMLSRNSSVWNVSVGNCSFVLSGRELSKDFFVTGGDSKINLVQGMLNGSPVIGQARNTIREDQNFSLEIMPSVTGYMTLFYVDNNGIVVNLMENEPVEEGVSFIYPNPDIYPEGLVAESAAGFKFSTDMILGLFSSKPGSNFARFGKVSESSVDINNDDLYAYGSLLEILKGELPGVSWCSSVIHVEGNKP